MKKSVALFLALIIILTILTACGDKEKVQTPLGNEQSNQGGQEMEDPEDSSSIIGEIINDDGEEFIADTSVSGEIKASAEPIGGTKFEIGGDTYTFPIQMSQLFNNGWNLSQGYTYQTEFEANSCTNLVSYYLVHESGVSIHLDQIVNDSSEAKDIKECTLTGFSIDQYYITPDFNFVIPGGITPKSTAANVLFVFGDPNNSSEFMGYSYNLERQLTYSKHEESNVSYIFSFYEDGSVSAIRIEYEGE